MTYVGKGYGDTYDAQDGGFGYNEEQCLALCKEKYLKDNSWYGCAHKPVTTHCRIEKNPRGFIANNYYGYWRVDGENLFVF